jgi:hypothetical protein
MNRDELIFKILDLKNQIRRDESKYEEAIRVNDEFEAGFYKSVIIFRNEDLGKLIENLILFDRIH